MVSKMQAEEDFFLLFTHPARCHEIISAQSLTIKKSLKNLDPEVVADHSQNDISSMLDQDIFGMTANLILSIYFDIIDIYITLGRTMCNRFRLSKKHILRFERRLNYQI